MQVQKLNCVTIAQSALSVKNVQYSWLVSGVNALRITTVAVMACLIIVEQLHVGCLCFMGYASELFVSFLSCFEDFSPFFLLCKNKDFDIPTQS